MGNNVSPSDDLSSERFLTVGIEREVHQSVHQLVSPCRRRSSRFVINSRFSRRMHRGVCASSAPTGFCGSCCHDGGPVGAGVYTSFAPIQ